MVISVGVAAKANTKTDALAELGYRFSLDGFLVEISSGPSASSSFSFSSSSSFFFFFFL